MLRPTMDRGDVPAPALLIVATVASTIEQFLVPYAVRMRSLGWRVEAAAAGYASSSGAPDAFDAVHELPLSRSILDLPGMLGGWRTVRALVEAVRPDIVHVHTPIAALVTRAAVRSLPAPRRPAVVYTAHGFHFHPRGHPAANAVFLLAECAAGRWTDRLIVINHEDEAAARRHRIVRPGQLLRMAGIGIDTRRYAPGSVAPDSVDEARRRLGIPPGACMFASVGELNRNKRQADAIAALAAMRSGPAYLVLLGEGPLRGRLDELVRAAGVKERVVFAGFVPDVRPVLASAQALLSTSEREGLSRSVMEALAMGVPVIATDARGNRELVSESGIVVPVGDVGAIAAAMDALVADTEKRRAMGARGHERMVAGYDLQALLRQHAALYAELVEERARPPRSRTRRS